MPEDKLLNLKDVLRLIPVGRTTIWSWRKTGNFPPPVQMPGDRVMWRHSDIQTWIKERKS